MINRIRDAPKRIERYCAATTGYAWPAYDIDNNPELLTATDLLSPALLSYPIKSKYLNEMFWEPAKDEGPNSNSYFDLRVALERFVKATSESTSAFERWKISEQEVSQEWTLFRTALNTSKRTKGLSTVAITKILHRKRPKLVPLVDRRIRAFFGRRKLEDDQLFQDIQQFVVAHGNQLDEWRKPYSLSNGQPMSRLRVLDIAIWMQWETL